MEMIPTVLLIFMCLLLSLFSNHKDIVQVNESTEVILKETA